MANVYQEQFKGSRPRPPPKVKPPPPAVPKKRGTPTSKPSVGGKEPPHKEASSCRKSADATIDNAMVSSEKVYRLADFIEYYGHLLPLRVKVTEGFCGKDEDSVISAGDMYNFHFIKNETVVTFQDDGGRVFSLPLNSAIKFGLLYDPVRDTKRAIIGYLFHTIGDILKCRVSPRVIVATKMYRGGKPSSSVDAEEILIVTSIQRTTTERQKPHIKVFSLSTRKKKILYEDCQGHFSTTPGSMRLFLTDIVERLKNSLPLKAVLFLDSDILDNSIVQLESEVVTLNQVNVETSIVATSCFNESEDIQDIDENVTPIAIPIDLKIFLTVDGDNFEDDVLYEDTRQLYDTFNPSNIKTMSSSDYDECYMGLRDCRRSDCDYQALEVIKPNRIFTEVKPSHPALKDNDYEVLSKESPAPSVPVKSELPKTVSGSISKTNPSALTDTRSKNSNPYMYVIQGTFNATSSVPVKSESPPTPTSRSSSLKSTDVGSTSSDSYYGTFSKMSPVASGDAENTKQLSTQLELVLSTLSDLMGKYDSLQREVEQIKKAIGLSGDVSKLPSDVSSKVAPHVEKNLQELRSLSCQQVQSVLQNMNLAQYAALFSNENIDGVLLSEFDDNILQHDLHITSFIHRAKLMKLIKGTTSVSDYLKK